MQRIILFVFVLMFCVVGSIDAEVRVENAFPGIKFRKPLYLTYVPDGSGRLVVTEKKGDIFAFPNDPTVQNDQVIKIFDGESTVKRLQLENEEGLLGFAIHPDFKENGYVFMHYTAHNPRRGVIARYTADKESLVIDPKSKQVILEVKQPWGNHNGGTITFGPDGYFYIGFGDGGSSGDPRNNGQDRSTLLGSILRIDVDKQARGKQYAIPRGNPFARKRGMRPEIYAYGIRNPWRFSFDRETDDLWAGDVGQNAYEEVDVIVKGGNYGWRAREGFHAFKNGKKTRGMIDPVWEYPRKDGVSITGGYVYRGKKVPELEGAYVFADFATSHVWALWVNRKTGKVTKHTRLGHGYNPASFGEDAEGEVYICAYGDGGIFKFVQD
ncbi:PQQ-dependent sugar dehydrogenase [Poriferisphaera sp. WC338]|uniref:PQQ-dependent sugar dehydrogenase n=1 Tax=Poriferisphaera sp. WC338 TaxID=3425129 RepID=UPI003D814528